jgi:hypothetical protein
MTTPSEHFERELEIFRTEAEAGTQFFYADLAVHAVAADHKMVHELLNQTPLFWNTCLGALQTATFIALGRVFDQDSRHNLDKLLRIAQNNPQVFSRVALGRRRQGSNLEKPEWLDEFLREAYEPTPNDFRRIRSHIKKRRRAYESNYRDLRHKVFAHKVAADHAEVAALFGKTNIRELQRLFAFLSSLYEAHWQLFFNGRKPVLRPLRYSVKRIRAVPSPGRRNTVQEKITHEAEQFLTSASRVSLSPVSTSTD